jgi:hypothetical protein
LRSLFLSLQIKHNVDGKQVGFKQQGDIEVVRELMEILSVDNNIATLLAQRNITTFEEAKLFFRPDFEQLMIRF